MSSEDPSSIFYEFDTRYENEHKKAEVAAAIRAVERKMQAKAATLVPSIKPAVVVNLEDYLPLCLAEVCFRYTHFPHPCREQIDALNPGCYRRYEVLLQIESISGEPKPFMQCYQVTLFCESSPTSPGIRKWKCISGDKDAPYNRHNDMFSGRWNRMAHSHPADIGDGESDPLTYRNPVREQLRVPRALRIHTSARGSLLGRRLYLSRANTREWDLYCQIGMVSIAPLWLRQLRTKTY